MNPHLRILHLEDDPVDTELVLELLRQDGLDAEVERVDTLAAFRNSLEDGGHALILADYSVPGLDPLGALRLARQVRPETPFVFLSGKMGEEVAIETLKLGATDYVLKQRMTRLVPAVRRALQEAEQQARRRQAEQELVALRDRLAADLAAMHRLHEISTRFAGQGDVDALLDQTIDAAIAITGADMGSMRLFDEASGAIKIRLQRGSAAPFLDCLDGGPDGSGACVPALRRGESLVIEDVARSPLFDGTPAREAMLAAGIRAFQVTPLSSRSGRLLGVLSTHSRWPGRPEERDLQLVDLLAHQAANFIEWAQREEALEQSEQRFRTMAETVPDIIFTSRPDGACEYVNSRFYQVVGLRPGDWAGCLWEGRLHPDDVGRATRAWQRSVETGEPLAVEYRLRTADGSYRWYVARAQPVRDEQQRIVKWFGVCVDVHDLKMAQAELEAARETAEKAQLVAEEANRAKDQFIAVLSHELRTPLTPILWTVHLLESDENLSQKQREHLDRVRRNVWREARLIDDLLDVNRVVHGKLQLNRRQVVLQSVLQHALDVCKPDLEDRRLHFRVDVPPEPCTVEADEARLQQVFWNLLKNAAKFTPPNGCVGVRCHREDNQVVTEISDSGVGIKAEAMGRIFQAFEQGEQGSARRFGGLGLGLAIAKALVEVHGGTITASSLGTGQGATFTVRLPLVSTSNPAAAERPLSSEKPAPVHKPSLRILLVEDNDDTAGVVARSLREAGHRVEMARDVAKALERAAEEEFDLLISDLGLPDGNGMDLLRELRARGRKFPGIALTGYGQEQDLRRTQEVGFVAHLIKPVDPEELEHAISGVVGARS